MRSNRGNVGLSGECDAFINPLGSGRGYRARRRRSARCAVGEPDFGQELVRPRLALVAVRTAADHRHLDVLTRGERRFEIEGLNEEKDYLQAEVSFFDDEDAAV